jgi:ribosomal-protein-serine acetyltransferase
MVSGDLELRPWRPEDVDAMAAAVAESIEHLRPWMPWIAYEPMTRERRLALISDWAAAAQEGTAYNFGMFVDGEPVGSSGIHRRVGQGGVEIGYWVHVAWTGQGIATRTAEALTEFAFELPGIDHVEIHHDRANLASRSVPEKLGYDLVAEEADEVEAPGECGMECVWRVTRAGWRARLTGGRVGPAPRT